MIDTGGDSGSSDGVSHDGGKGGNNDGGSHEGNVEGVDDGIILSMEWWW